MNKNSIILSDLCVLCVLCVSKFFLSPLTPSSLNPFLFILSLSLLISPCLAWDDEEFDAPSRSTRNNSSIYSTSTKSLLQDEDLYSPKQPIQPDRPQNTEVIARSITKINQFFALVPRGTRGQ